MTRPRCSPSPTCAPASGPSAQLVRALRRLRRPLYRHPARPWPPVPGLSPRSCPITELCPLNWEEWDAFRRVTFRRAGQLDLGQSWPGQLHATGAGAVRGQQPQEGAQEIFTRWPERGTLPPLHPHVPRPPARPAGGDPPPAEGGPPLPGGVHLPDRGRGGCGLSQPCTGRRPGWTPSSRPPAGATGRANAPPGRAWSPFSGGGPDPAASLQTAIGAGRWCPGPAMTDIASHEAVHAYFHDVSGPEGGGGPGQSRTSCPPWRRSGSPSAPWRSAST